MHKHSTGNVTSASQENGDPVTIAASARRLAEFSNSAEVDPESLTKTMPG
jgi:hypothetical protein